MRDETGILISKYLPMNCFDEVFSDSQQIHVLFTLTFSKLILWNDVGLCLAALQIITYMPALAENDEYGFYSLLTMGVSSGKTSVIPPGVDVPGPETRSVSGRRVRVGWHCVPTPNFFALLIFFKQMKFSNSNLDGIWHWRPKSCLFYHHTC